MNKDKKRRKLELRTDEDDGRQYRRFPVEELRVIRKEGEAAVIEGYAAVFNKWSEDLGGFREKIRPGSFAKSITKDDVRALWNHDSNYVLGRNTNGTLKLSEDTRGLHVEIDPPDTQWARDHMVSIERGDVTQMSFGFFTVADDWNYPDEKGMAKGKLAERELIEADLFDVSPVTYPAYPQTKVAVRSAIDLLIAKAEAGELTDDDKATVQTAIDTLQGSLPVSEVPPTDAGDSTEPPAETAPEGGTPDPVVQDLTVLKTLLEIEQAL